MSVIVFDVELAGDEHDVMQKIIVHHNSFEQTPFPIAHVLNVASDEFGWDNPWIELRSQLNGEVLVLMQYVKDNESRWCKSNISGAMPHSSSRVDLYLLDHRPNSIIDSWFDV